MTLQEFISKKPEFVEKASKVTSKEDFVKLAEREKIKFGSGCLDKVYAFICGGKKKDGEISEDALEMVSGGVGDLGVTSVDLGDGEQYIIT